jgi:hypothetical protein
VCSEKQNKYKKAFFFLILSLFFFFLGGGRCEGDFSGMAARHKKHKGRDESIQ